MDYMTIKEAAELWGLSRRWVQTMCSVGKIEGAVKFGGVWAIPKDARKPEDKRVTTGKYKNWRKNKN
ncbi:MAG: helix-turn-helix domain-containing protein [Clostridiales bacterium]|nr:helix-turn-helix domain-containing protein [Clostridiales bacterium]